MAETSSTKDDVLFDNQFENDFTDPEDLETDSVVVHESEVAVQERESLSSYGVENPISGAEGPPSGGNEFNVKATVKDPHQQGWSKRGNVTSQTSDVTKKLESDRADSRADLKMRIASGNKKFIEPVWKLDDKDLMCLPIVTEITGSRAMKLINVEYNKTTRRRVLRLNNKRDKSYSRIRHTSMLGMVKSIAKSSGVDITKLLQSSEHFFGSSRRLPCMQCFEAQRGGKLHGMQFMMEDTSWMQGGGANDRCSKCGGQVHTLASFGRMVSQMRSVLQEKELVPHDVYPDGNCLFAAVVDQLRIRGDFNFTMYTLRQAAVRYLKDNPMAEDGLTPLEMFLVNESWEAYLTRMAQDGVWGDHMVLGAISNVTGRQIAIYGGMSGTGETIIKPKILSDLVEASKNVNNTIFLGHLSESHYMSLRPKHWKQKLFDDKFVEAFIGLPCPDNHLLTGQSSREEPSNPIDAVVDDMCTTTRKWETEILQKVPCPIQHINLILRQAFRLSYIKSAGSEAVESGMMSMHINKQEDNGADCEAVGPVICQMFPGKPQTNLSEDDISIFFPDASDDLNSTGSGDAPVIFLEVPRDTVVVRSLPRAQAIDLVAENDASSPDIVHLVPKCPSLWAEQIFTANDGATFLKTFNMHYETMDSALKPINSRKCGFKAFYAFAFKCEWPDSAIEWTTRRRPANFPNTKTIRTVVDGGCHAVPLDRKLDDIIEIQIPKQEKVGNHSWSYTFAAAEKEISRFLTPEQRQCFLLFKAWVDSSSGENRIPNSVLKSTFFYSCENIEKQDWKTKPGACLMILLKNLQSFLTSEYAPHYFIADKNLFAGTPNENITTWSGKLKVAQAQSFVTLFFILDQLDVLSSELGSFVEEIIQDMLNDASDSFQEVRQQVTLIPARSALLQSLIYQEDYQSAMYIFQDTAEVAEQLEETGISDEKYAELLKCLCPDMHIDYQWLFALFVDISIKTKVTSKLVDFGVVHITEVFGPECLEELPDTLVPEMFKIENGDLLFAVRAMSVFSQCVSGKCLIKAFKFYAKKYAELAGNALMLPTSAEFLQNSPGKVDKIAIGSRQLMQEYITASTQLSYLHSLYVRLYNTCFYGHQTEEFREMMPVMTKIAESVGTQLAHQNLKVMWTGLGEWDKAARIRVPAAGENESRYLTF